MKIQPQKVSVQSPEIPQISDTPASVNIDSIVLEGFPSVSGAAVKEGFAETWTKSSLSWAPGMGKGFASGIDLALPRGATGRVIGQRLAQAIIDQARKDSA